MRKKKPKIRDKEIENWIKDGLNKGYDADYLNKILEIYKLEKKAYDAVKKNSKNKE